MLVIMQLSRENVLPKLFSSWTRSLNLFNIFETTIYQVIFLWFTVKMADMLRILKD